MGLTRDLREIKIIKICKQKRRNSTMIWNMEEEIMGKEIKMITGLLHFLIIFAVIGSILYGRRLIKTEKVDAVLGNPEKAKGGTHWVIVGSSFLLLVWLYYSWDIAKSFYPKSANELCQVAKVNESLLALKYLFPIEEGNLKAPLLLRVKIKILKNSY
jgi:taurine transport system permease protein